MSWSNIASYSLEAPLFPDLAKSAAFFVDLAELIQRENTQIKPLPCRGGLSPPDRRRIRLIPAGIDRVVTVRRLGPA